MAATLALYDPDSCLPDARWLCSSGLLTDFGSYLSFDAANGVESAAILWGCTPASHACSQALSDPQTSCLALLLCAWTLAVR